MAKQKIILFFTQILLGGLFLYSGVTKLQDLSKFAEVVKGYQLLPLGIVPFTAVYVGSLETLLGFAFLFKKTVKTGAICCALLLIFFQVALVTLVFRGIEMDCGCFGGFGFSPKLAILRNFIILAQISYILYILFNDNKLIYKKSN